MFFNSILSQYLKKQKLSTFANNDESSLYKREIELLKKDNVLKKGNELFI